MTLEWVRKALDADDPTTGTSVPVLVLGDSGGAAHDLFEYWGRSWDTPDAERTLPTTDGKLRDAAYVAAAKRLLPQILKLGAKTGQNTTRQLDFFTLGRGAAELNEPLAFQIQRAMMNDCPDINEEALLSVVWGEPAFLQMKLEEAAGEILHMRGGEREDARERKDLLQLALLRKDVPVVETILRFSALTWG